jgi:hypothetical protein
LAIWAKYGRLLGGLRLSGVKLFEVVKLMVFGTVVSGVYI